MTYAILLVYAYISICERPNTKYIVLVCQVSVISGRVYVGFIIFNSLERDPQVIKKIRRLDLFCRNIAHFEKKV
jgi:hypothetical protein